MQSCYKDSRLKDKDLTRKDKGMRRQQILPYHRHVSEQSATERFVLRPQKPETV